eukprot:CCRYP_006107-RA/>CCRYP_006107-RA protein AED:0.14 eAED:0.14 QI:490/1/1/1/1/1/2/416/624
MKYLEDPRLTQLTSDLTEAFLNTRGSGNPSGGALIGTKLSNRRRNSNRGTKQHHHRGSGSSRANLSTPLKVGSSGKKSTATASSSPYLPSSTFHYNPAGYTSYDGGTSSSSRVIYGKIEAYTTKRAGSDKKTAHEVGEKYAHEMEKLNEAVEEMKKKHLMEKEMAEEIAHPHETTTDATKQLVTDSKRKMKIEEVDGEEAQPKKRDRSRSLDGVTFAGSKVTCDASPTFINAPILETNGASHPIVNEEREEQVGNRARPLEGILKQASSSKRWRATSFDISTGPSSFALEASRRGRIVSTGNHDEVDQSVHPLIPQPSLYQSSLAEPLGKAAPSLLTMAPRRLVTDLILTLNASFPDYDFGDARPSDFCTLSLSEAMRRINENMSEFASTTDKGRDFMPRFWAALDDIVFGLKDAEVYSYAPQGGGGDDDPLGFLTQSLAGGVDNGAISGSCLLFPDEETVLDGFDDSSTLELPHRILTSPVTKSEETAQVTLWSMNYFFVSRNKKRIVLFTCVLTMRSPQGGEEFDEETDEYQYGENDLVFDEARRSKTQEESESSYTTYSNAGRTSRSGFMAEDVDVYGIDVEVDEDDADGDEDKEEKEFDTGELNRSVHPRSANSDHMMMA